jgi:plastocyanin
MRIRHVAAFALVLGLTFGALAGPSQAATRDRATIPVSIIDFAFMPNRALVHVGDTVMWTNNGATSHTSTSRTWDSGVLAPGASFSFTFTTVGIFKYRCQIHPTTMLGGIKVVAAGG